MKPVIGLIPLVDEQRESLWMLPGYMDGIANAGGLPIMLPLSAEEGDPAQLLPLCDGFLFTGGHDVSPEIYGAARLSVCGTCSSERDMLETTLLRLAISVDKPVLGICRGIQLINAALGGSLWQDLPTQHPSAVEHHQQPPYDRPAHSVDILPGTPLRALLGTPTLAVNSYHHQAVRDLAPSLSPMALSPDGLVEALWRPASRFLWAVQWHPEFSWRTDAAARAVFGALLHACRDKQSSSCVRNERA